jgi:chromosomal replication initiation ATPase DnaA
MTRNCPTYIRHPGAMTDDMRALRDIVAAKHRVPAIRLISPCKKKNVVPARAEWFYRMITEQGREYSDVGHRTDFHHTSVMYLVRKHSRLVCGTDPKASLEAIRAAYSAFCEDMAA